MSVTAIGIEAVEQGLVPDALTRMAIRRLCREHLRKSRNEPGGELDASRSAFLESMRSGPIALVPEMANQQHYELPPEFFTAILGPRRKYSCCYFPIDRNLSYPFETDGALNWMGRHFFTGGIMPSADLLNQFNRALTVSQQYSWSGRHYQRTAEAWLANLDVRRDNVLRILAAVYGSTDARRWLNRWRMFFLAVSELFGYGDGDEWFVSHYVMDHRTAS